MNGKKTRIFYHKGEMLDFDYSWKALLRPGETDVFFDIHDRMKFDAANPDFSYMTAWWLSELSRLSYRQGKEEIGSRADSVTRNNILERLCLRELKFIRKWGFSCSVVESQSDWGSDFLVVAFRGTISIGNWLSNFCFMQGKWPKGGLVHRGFRFAFSKLWREIEPLLNRSDVPVLYTGHSLGGALATLAASIRPPLALYTFGAPRVGDSSFLKTLDSVATYRFFNKPDIVPTVPFTIDSMEYIHVGEPFSMGDLHISNKYKELTTKERLLSPPVKFFNHSAINYTANIERML